MGAEAGNPSSAGLIGSEYSQFLPICRILIHPPKTNRRGASICQSIGMTCAACAARIEKVLNRLPGVQASVNLASERARVELAPDTASPKQVIASIEKAGFSVPQQTLNWPSRA